jgi:hypothetical protein
VPRKSVWELTPKQSIELECARRGRAEVVAGCIRLLRCQDVDDELVIALGGPMAQGLLDAGLPQVHRYWLRVWGARGLLHVYGDEAEASVIAALADQHWRVREMAAKVVARHQVGAALTAVAELRGDPVARVRVTAGRATMVLTAAGR